MTDNEALREQIAHLKVIERAQSRPDYVMNLIADGAEIIDGFNIDEMKIVFNLQIKRFTPEARRRIQAEILLLEEELTKSGTD